MPDLNDFHAFKSTSGGDEGGGGNFGSGGLGCGCVVIIVVAIMLICFIVNNASWDAIDCLLGFGFLAFLIARSLF